MDYERQQILVDTLGDDIKNIKPILMGKSNSSAKTLGVDPDVLLEIQENVEQKLSKFKTHREILEAEANSLAECVAVATELYKQKPVPDYAFQLGSLANAHKSILQQLEKMKDPKLIIQDIESQIRTMFMQIIKAFALEIDKTKKEMQRLTPEHRTSVEDLFNRMLNAIQPETQNIYDDLYKNLKKVLGIK